jgi:hypothetical protein
LQGATSAKEHQNLDKNQELSERGQLMALSISGLTEKIVENKFYQ